jgi:ABC-2 type transport system permease protein
MGLFEAELATPVPAWIVLGVGPAYELVLATLRSALYFALIAVVFGVSFPHASFATLALGAPLILGAFGGIGLLAGATTMLVRRSNPVGAMLASASFLLSGVAYPVSVLPAALRVLSQALPTTHALELVRGALLRGASVAEMGRSLGALALFAGLTIPLGVVLFVFALRRARIDGSLSHY